MQYDIFHMTDSAKKYILHQLGRDLMSFYNLFMLI